MRKLSLLLILVILFSYSRGQTPSTIFNAPDTNYLHTYFGNADRLFSKANTKDYILCTTCITDSIIGAGGRKWRKLSDAEKVDLSKYRYDSTNFRSLITNATTGAFNGLTKTGLNVGLGGSLNSNTLEDIGANSLTFNFTNPTGLFLNRVVASSTNTFNVGNLVTNSSTSNTFSDGFGGLLEFENKGINGVFRNIAGIEGVRDGNDSSGRFKFLTFNAGVLNSVFELSKDGQAKFNNYGVGTFTGTATKILQTDVSGNIVEGGISYADTTNLLQTASYVIEKIFGTTYARPAYKSGLPAYSGTTSSTVINSAIASLTSGGTVFFRRQIDTITAKIVDGGNSNIRLAFEKGAILFAVAALNDQVIEVTSVSNWLIDGATIDGNTTNQTNRTLDPSCIYIDGCSNVIIDHSYLYNGHEYGVFFKNNNTFCGIQNSKINLCDWNLITFGNNDNGCFVNNNECSNSGDVGITTYSNKVKITNNYVHDIQGLLGFNNGRWGIGIEGGNGSQVDNNLVVNVNVGIHVSASIDSNIVSNNRVYAWDLGNSFLGAIELYGNSNTAYNNVMSKNFGTASVGFSISGNKNVVSTNKTTGTRGILINAGADETIIQDNTIIGSSGAILISSSTSDNTIITNNDWKGSGADVSDAGTGTKFGVNVWADGSMHLSDSAHLALALKLDKIDSIGLTGFRSVGSANKTRDSLGALIGSNASIVTTVTGLRAVTSVNANVVYETTDYGTGNWYWNASSTATDNTATIIKATSITTGRFIRIYSGKLNVLWFGALGDSSTDNTSTIQAGETFVSSINGELYFPQGIYITQPILMKSNVRHTGDGAKSIIKLKGGLSGQAKIFSSTYITNNIHDVSFEDLVLDGNATNNPGLTSGASLIRMDSASSNFYFKKVFFQNAKCINLSSYCTNKVSISYCTFNICGEGSIYLDGDTSVFFTHNIVNGWGTLSLNDYDGLTVNTAGRGYTVSTNYFNNTGHAKKFGIEFFTATNTIGVDINYNIMDNISGNGGVGISINILNGNIIGNQILNIDSSQFIPIALETAGSNLNIKDNIISNGYISVGGPIGVNISNISIEHNNFSTKQGGTVMRIGSVDSSTISSIEIKSNTINFLNHQGGNGILLYGNNYSQKFSRVNIIGNNIYGGTLSGISAIELDAQPSYSHVIIKGNYIDSCANGIFDFSNSSSLITGNTILYTGNPIQSANGYITGNILDTVYKYQLPINQTKVIEYTGTPEGNVAANVGSILLNTSGGSGTSFYIKESGSGNTGWIAPAKIASPTFTGTVTMPTPFTLGATSVTATGTQLNILNSATTGDIIYASGTNTWARLGIGTSKQHLGSNGTIPIWKDTATAGSSYTAGRGLNLIGSAFSLDTTQSYTLNGTISGANARGLYITPTLAATGNNQILYGLDISPTFNQGAFTGVGNFALRVNNRITASGSSLELDRNNGDGVLYTDNGELTFINSVSTARIGFRLGGSDRMRIMPTTNNVIIQNGGTFSDNGYRLDIQGSLHILNKGTFDSSLKVAILPSGANTDSLVTWRASDSTVRKVVRSGVSGYAHNISTPTTGSTVTLTNNQYNIINPAGALLALTVNLPSSPSNNDVVYIKFTQNVTTVTYGNGTVVDGITAPTAGGLTVLTYDSGTTSWY